MYVCQSTNSLLALLREDLETLRLGIIVAVVGYRFNAATPRTDSIYVNGVRTN